MKVAIISNNIPPVIDGVGDFTDLFSLELSKRNTEVFIICKRGINPQLTNSNINVFPVVDQWNKNGFYEALHVLKTQQPNFILFQFVPYSFNRWGIPMGLIGIINSIHGMARIGFVFHETYIRKSIWPLQTNLVSFLQRYVLHKVAKKIEISITSIDRYLIQLKKLGFTALHLVPIPANIETVEINEEHKLQLKKKTAPQQEKIIVALGNRNYDLLIQTFQNINQNRKDLKLVILGNQNYEIKKKPDNVIVTGVLSRIEIIEYLSISDLYISFDPVKNGKGGTSNKSGSLAIALAMGLPVVGFKGDMNN
ncbi:MAG: glycosyltransferase, partial [Chitinophagaceae bacterium]